MSADAIVAAFAANDYAIVALCTEYADAWPLLGAVVWLVLVAIAHRVCK